MVASSRRPWWYAAGRRRRHTVLTVTALTGAAVPASAGTDDTLVVIDSRSDVAAGVGLSRVRVHNGDQLVVTTRHRNLRKLAYNDHFTVWVDTRTSHRGPDYVISGGLSSGTDWATGRATSRWHTRIDPLDGIGTCASGVDISWGQDKARITLGRDCLGGYEGRVRVSVVAGNADVTDYVPARKTFTDWVARG